MKIAMRLIDLQLVLAVALGPMTLAAHGHPIAIEFFNAKLGHYFLSADEPEIASLRDNPALGWAPTGQQFAVFDRLDVSTTVRPVCRFYGSVTPGPNSHFYTANDNECSELKALQATTPDTEPRWNFEGVAFAAILPFDGECASPSPIKVFRAYNNQAGSGNTNHRFTTDPTLYHLMLRLGWKPEGVAMCVPALTPEVPV